MNLQLLEKLYLTHSPSHKETPMANLVKQQLDDLCLDYEQDKLEQIYRILPGKPLVVAHMDQVQANACHKVMSFKNRLYGFSKKGKLRGLGADDKNGIFILLSLLTQFRDEMSFIFSTAEEVGGNLQQLLPELNLATTPYGLIFDRKGRADIIGTANDYCCDDLELAIEVLSDKLKYRAAQGIFSDGDALSDYVPCVNLSCGYYEAHTTSEYTKTAELHRALTLGERLITSLPRKNNPFEMPHKFTPAYGKYAKTLEDHKEYSYGHYKWDRNGYKVSKTTAPWDYSQCALIVEDDQVYFYDDLGQDIFIAESIEDACGSWNTDMGTLQITLLSNGEVSANIGQNEIEVEDCRLEELQDDRL